MEICSECGKEFDPIEGKFFENRWFCRECTLLVEQIQNCFKCGREVARWEYSFFQGHYYCNDCYKAVRKEWIIAHSCAECGKELPLAGPVFTRPDGKRICFDCYKKQAPRGKFGVKAAICISCRREVEEKEEKLAFYDNLVICKKCFKERLKGKIPPLCSSCGHIIYTKSFNIGRDLLCSKCYSKRMKKEFCGVCGKEIKAIRFVRPDGSLICLECSKKSEQKATYY